MKLMLLQALSKIWFGLIDATDDIPTRYFDWFEGSVPSSWKFQWVFGSIHQLKVRFLFSTFNNGPTYRDYSPTQSLSAIYRLPPDTAGVLGPYGVGLIGMLRPMKRWKK